MSAQEGYRRTPRNTLRLTRGAVCDPITPMFRAQTLLSLLLLARSTGLGLLLRASCI
ncbi:hypothetical protein P3T43_002608 [Paraburkholderia sp. GAS41]